MSKFKTKLEMIAESSRLIKKSEELNRIIYQINNPGQRAQKSEYKAYLTDKCGEFGFKFYECAAHGMTLPNGQQILSFEE